MRALALVFFRGWRRLLGVELSESSLQRGCDRNSCWWDSKATSVPGEDRHLLRVSPSEWLAAPRESVADPATTGEPSLCTLSPWERPAWQLGLPGVGSIFTKHH